MKEKYQKVNFIFFNELRSVKIRYDITCDIILIFKIKIKFYFINVFNYNMIKNLDWKKIKNYKKNYKNLIEQWLYESEIGKTKEKIILLIVSLI